MSFSLPAWGLQLVSKLVDYGIKNGPSWFEKKTTVEVVVIDAWHTQQYRGTVVEADVKNIGLQRRQVTGLSLEYPVQGRIVQGQGFHNNLVARDRHKPTPFYLEASSSTGRITEFFPDPPEWKGELPTQAKPACLIVKLFPSDFVESKIRIRPLPRVVDGDRSATETLGDRKWIVSDPNGKLDLEISQHESANTKGLIASLLNSRSHLPIESCTLIVLDVNDYHPELARFTENNNFKSVQVIAPDKIEPRKSGKSGWLLRVCEDDLEIGSTTREGVLHWPNPSDSAVLWKLNMTVEAKNEPSWRFAIYAFKRRRDAFPSLFQDEKEAIAMLQPTPPH